MKKQENKNNVKRIIIKIINICSYAIAITAIFILILVSIFSCSGADEFTEEDASLANSLVQETNLRVKNNFISKDNPNIDSQGYFIKNGDSLYKPYDLPKKENIATYYVSLGSTYVMTVRDSNDSVHAIDETWTVIFNIHANILNGDFIRFETPNFTRVYTASLIDNTFYLSYEYAPENYTYEEIFFPVSLPYNAENYDRFKIDINTYFRSVSYSDYALNLNSWDPNDFMVSSSSRTHFVVDSNTNPQLLNTFVNNEVFGNSLKILDSTLFVNNGYIYTDLLMHCQILNKPTFYVYDSDYSNPQETYVAYNTVYFIDFVYCYNANSQRFNIIWTTSFENPENTNDYHVYKFLNGFINPNLSYIRIFDRHLNTEVLGTYTNYSVLQVNSSIVDSNISNGEVLDAVGEVFDLIGFSFTSIFSLLNVKVGKGLTLLSLALIPFVVGILLFVIHLFKR